MQTPPLPLPLGIAPIFMKEAHSAESNQKCIFQILYFELWLIVFTIHKNLPTKKLLFKFTGKIRISILYINFDFFFVRLLVFEIWSILYIVNIDVCDLMYLCKTLKRFL